MRLVPPDQNLGWTPYAWLLYLAFFLAGPVLGEVPAWYLGVTGLGLAVFLFLYFRTYWLSGWRALVGIAGIALLGVLFAPTNIGASTFFIYAGAFTGSLGSRRRAVGTLVALCALIVAVGLLLQDHPFFMIPALVCTPLIGALVLRTRDIAQTNERLRLSRDEAAHLAKIAERERIARDLHDLLGHTLSMITIKSELAAKLLDRDPARAGAEIRDVERISRQALKEVRSAVAGFRAGSLEEEIDNARKALAAVGVRLEFTPVEVGLGPLQEGVLALALREAVTNVVRHARATTCRVLVESDGRGVRLVVEDDGRGLPAPEGSGLAGMRERVTALGGLVKRHFGEGTRLVIQLPSAEGTYEALEAPA